MVLLAGVKGAVEVGTTDWTALAARRRFRRRSNARLSRPGLPRVKAIAIGACRRYPALGKRVDINESTQRARIICKSDPTTDSHGTALTSLEQMRTKGSTFCFDASSSLEVRCTSPSPRFLKCASVDWSQSTSLLSTPLVTSVLLS